MTHTVTIRRHDVWRVVDMPGLARIDFEGHRRAALRAIREAPVLINFQTQPEGS